MIFADSAIAILKALVIILFFHGLVSERKSITIA